MDLKLKLGDVQSMSFGSNGPPPFFVLAAPPKDKRVVKRGKLEQKEGYAGKPKGIKQVLWERGWYVNGMSTTSTDPKMNIEMVLGGLQDFKNERTALQHTVERRGHILVCPPSFTPSWLALASTTPGGCRNQNFEGKSTTRCRRTCTTTS